MAFREGAYCQVASPSFQTIYVASWDGKLYALNADGTKQWDYDLGVGTEGSPLIAPDGTVYVTTVTSLCAIKGSSPLANSPWPMFRGNAQRTAKAFQLGIQATTSAANGLIDLTLSTELDTNYTIDVSTDLLHWTTLTTFTSTNTLQYYEETDSAVVGPRFYRLRSP